MTTKSRLNKTERLSKNTMLNCLLIFAMAFFLISDIIMALLLGYVLPKHLMFTQGWYPADGRDATIEELGRYCPCIWKRFPNGTTTTFSLNPIPPALVDETLADVPPGHEDDYHHGHDDYDEEPVDPPPRFPFLVAITEAAPGGKLNENVSARFVCNGLVNGSDILLTGANCLNEHEKFLVRSESTLWGLGGKLHTITHYDSLNKYIQVAKVNPPFSEEVQPKMPFKYAVSTNWTYAVAPSWNLRTARQQEFGQTENFRVRILTTNYTEKRTEVTFYDRVPPHCFTSSIFLITPCYEIIAVKSCRFSYITMNSSSLPPSNTAYELILPAPRYVCDENATMMRLSFCTDVEC